MVKQCDCFPVKFDFFTFQSTVVAFVHVIAV